MDFFDAMRKAKTIETQVEIYLLAEPQITSEELAKLVAIGNNNELSFMFQEKLTQESILLADSTIPSKWKEALKQKSNKTAKRHLGTNEKW